MSAVRNAQLRAAAFSHDSAYPYDDRAERRAERADEMRHALKANPEFIAEAIGNGDLSELVVAFQSGDAQHTHDAISDLVDAYMKAEEARVDHKLRRVIWQQSDDLDVLEHLTEVFGAAA